MLDNLWFWEKWLIDEYEKEACNLLAMNVELFPSIGKNLHRHNFQSSWWVVTQIGTDRTKERPTCLERVVRLWWKSLLCSRPKSLTFLFGLCPSSLLRKSSTLCCILFDVVRTCGFLENSSFWMLSTKTEIKLVSLKMQLGWETVSFTMSTLHCSPPCSTSTRSVWCPANKAYALCFAISSSMYSILDVEINK